MNEFEEAEAVVLDVMDGRKGFSDGLRAVVAYQEKWNENLCRYWHGRGFGGTQGGFASDISDTSGARRTSGAHSIGAADVPAVPVEVFRHLHLVSSELVPSRVFRTSGTTSGVRGEHRRFGTTAYDIGARRHFSDCVEADLKGAAAIHFVEDPSVASDSSLSHMVGDLSDYLGCDPVKYVIGDDGLRLGELNEVKKRLGGRHTFVFGTAFAFAHWLEEGQSWTLPAGSVVVETGGFKSREVSYSRAQYVKLLREAFGSEATYYTEYSMTELSSQGYGLLHRELGAQRYRFPPWCKVIACDPDTLEPVVEGETGILRFVDLANVETVVAVQTNDLGIVDGDEVRLLGRKVGARVRGCSLAAEELLTQR